MHAGLKHVKTLWNTFGHHKVLIGFQRATGVTVTDDAHNFNAHQNNPQLSFWVWAHTPTTVFITSWYTMPCCDFMKKCNNARKCNENCTKPDRKSNKSLWCFQPAVQLATLIWPGIQDPIPSPTQRDLDAAGLKMNMVLYYLSNVLSVLKKTVVHFFHFMTFWIECEFYCILTHYYIFREIPTWLGAISNLITFTFPAFPLFVIYCMVYFSCTLTAWQ